MSQEYTTTKKPRRTRVPRNRPVLVSSTGNEQGEQTEELNENSSTGTLSALPEVASEETEKVAPKAQRGPRLPSFFSKVGKSGQEATTNEADIAQARFARATRKVAGAQSGKAVTVAATDSDKVVKETQAPAKGTGANAKAQPPKLFKMRHILGMAIYLLAAQIVLPNEAFYAKQLGIEQKFFSFPLFGVELSITTSFLLNIVTLILLLFALVRLDLLPSSLTSPNRASAKTGTTARNQNVPVVKPAPPTMKQGVQGANDELYQAYRTQQRREKKR